MNLIHEDEFARGSGAIGNLIGAVASEILDTRTSRSSIRAALTAADRDSDERGLDSAAGCEFLDDRIRLESQLS